MKFINALVVKLVTQRTKILAACGCSSSLARDQEYKKIHIVCDNQKSKKIKFSLLRQLKNKKLNSSKVTIVVGGDGFLFKH